MNYQITRSSHLSPCRLLSLEGRRFLMMESSTAYSQPPYHLRHHHPSITVLLVIATSILHIMLHPAVITSSPPGIHRQSQARRSQHPWSSRRRRMIIGSICAHVITTGKSHRKLANYLPLSPLAAVTPGVVSTTTPVTGSNPGQPSLESHVSLITFSVSSGLDLRGFCPGINLH